MGILFLHVNKNHKNKKSLFNFFFFVSYNSFKNWFDDGKEKDLSRDKILLSATLAGVCTTLITNPIWLVKVRMETQILSHQSSYRGLNGKLKMKEKSNQINQE